MHYIPTTILEEKEMLSACGVDNISDLLRIIPSKYILDSDLGIGPPLSELCIERELQDLSNKNISGGVCFIGGGIYDHFIPKAVDLISGRSEFYTAYTPYQAEVSQGTLQYLYEYQTMICNLSGMDIANASLYDGASATAEACMLAHSVTNKTTILYSATLNRHYIEVMKTCLSGQKLDLIKIPKNNGITDLNFINNYTEDLAAVIIQSPNTYGIIENWENAKSMLEECEALLIAAGDPMSLSLLKSPGECGADIYIGEGQTLGNPMNYGGPLLGIISLKETYKRRIPGRLVGKTTDQLGNDGFVLALQTREQHIRRDKATSNICTNQGLLALRATIYMALMGKTGLPYVAQLCYQKGQYMANMINKLPSYTLKYGNQFLKEFVIETIHNVRKLTRYCFHNGFLIQDLNHSSNNCFQIAVTEKRTKREIDSLIECLKDYNEHIQ